MTDNQGSTAPDTSTANQTSLNSHDLTEDTEVATQLGELRSSMMAVAAAASVVPGM
jgi:hypothetical protein